ncbi:ABC transporter permease [Flavihumibacter cheonanensis]|uniref:ABC transporter permease n=1 Tax=Flavihumibacter cheonanensis TaxID=1442385 RepID=UPI001EF76E4A|nr:ABC transporter permease [Flavihumibacter cheonanensis]MCG7751146.1 ABC transporter permease [Flavihumibacter cheonanensis]
MTNDLIITIRHITRNKIYSVLNIAGIALGIAAFLLILEFISTEKSYNLFHADKEQMYRLVYSNPEGSAWSEMEPGIGPLIKEKLPVITDYCRYETGIAQGVVKVNNPAADPFRESAIGYVDGNFFSFFSFPVKAGKAAKLNQPFTCFLSEKAAVKYFPNQNPVGQTILLYNQFGEGIFRIAGVYSIPDNSDIQYDMVFSLETLGVASYMQGNDWVNINNLSSQYIQTMVKLVPGTDPATLEKQINSVRQSAIPENDGTLLHLQPLTQMHLTISFDDFYPTYGNLRYIYILGLVALLILCMAWFNYINLSTAQSIKRSHEISIRKIIGASRSSLVQLYLTESIAINLLGLFFALFLVYLIQPFFNTLIQKELSLTTIHWNTITLIGSLIFISGALLSGWYTALVITRFQPLAVIKSRMTISGKGVTLRKLLVVTQFAISIGLVLTTFIIYKQIGFMQKSALGMDIEKMLIVRGPSITTDSSFSIQKSGFVQSLESNPQIQEFTLTGSVPGYYYNFRTAGFSQPGSSESVKQKSFAFSIIDHRYLSTYRIPLVAGRNFTPAETAVEWNKNDRVLMNERAIEQLGFSSPEEALTKRVTWDERTIQVIGVVKNYHHTGLQNAIDPIIFYPQNNNVFYSIRLAPGNLKHQISLIEKTYRESFPNNPFEYSFADEQFNRQYLTETKYGSLFTTGAVWAILIACLGLFGLTNYSIQSRIKEIGIRKVVGASVNNIVAMLASDFIKLIVIAGIIACPVAWWAMQNWLDNFAYRIEISWWLLPSAIAVALIIAVATISIQTIRTALSNPVDALKSE